MTQNELAAFNGQVNLELLDDIISFAVHTAEPDRIKKDNLRRRCIFPNQTAGAGVLQRKYSFLYLGELLERYEERFGMSVQDRRAIALALGYTREITTEKMFVGTQLADFIQTAAQNAKDDIYLTGALYLLHEGQDTGADYESLLKEWQYIQTEELIFAMSLFPDAETILEPFKLHLPRLLGKERTISVLGNGEIFKRAIAMLFPLKKSMRAKNMAPLRALAALATSFVKESGKPYSSLIENGYTPLEIAYANAAAVCGHCVPDSPKYNSIITEKIVVELFRRVLEHDEALPERVFQQLNGLYKRYSRFDIMCYGTHRLEEALRDTRIQTPETMAWFIEHESIYHPAVDSFDIMDAKWEPLAVNLEPDVYQRLFELHLTENLGAGELQRHIDRYNTLTGKNYLDCYNTYGSGRRFSLLVQTGIVDLWAAFQDSLAPDGAIAKPYLLEHIKDYLRGIKTVQAFRFIRQFLLQYGFDGIKQYLARYGGVFQDQLWSRKDYRGNEITLSIQRDFLSDDPEGQLLMLYWVEEYFFTQEPERYIAFAQTLLENENTAALLPLEEQRRLFELVIGQSRLSEHDASRLKQRYQTSEEQAAEQAAREAARAEKQRQEQAKLVQSIQADYTETNSGTFSSVVKFLERYHSYNGGDKIAARVVCDDLEHLLQSKGYVLTQDEAGRFLHICGKLIRCGVMDWTETQSHISKIKEALPDDSNCNSAA